MSSITRNRKGLETYLKCSLFSTNPAENRANHFLKSSLDNSSWFGIEDEVSSSINKGSHLVFLFVLRQKTTLALFSPVTLFEPKQCFCLSRLLEECPESIRFQLSCPPPCLNKTFRGSFSPSVLPQVSSNKNCIVGKHLLEELYAVYNGLTYNTTNNSR